MAIDLAIHPTTGDLVFGPNHDFHIVAAEDVIEQRVRNRIRIQRGVWEYDPTQGMLGSNVAGALHLPRYRAINELELHIRHALEPMRDIAVREITVEEDKDDERIVKVTIFYTPVFDPSQEEFDDTAQREKIEINVEAV